MLTVIPETPLQPGTPVADAFLLAGCSTFRAAVQYTHALPYGRNASRSDFMLVLSEQRGTCSSKHALLAMLARECGLPIALVLGIYAMSGSNTPGAGAVLQRYGLEAVPEAHCVLRYEGQIIDITRQVDVAEALTFLHEEHIEPWQVAEYKVQVHRQFLAGWCSDRNLLFDEVWNIREECIAALG